MEFLSPTDIGNRALQHCGAEMMDATLGFTENSKRARQVSFSYGKLRQAELRRNVWRFATRKAALRSIDSNTLRLNPSLWVSTTTYFIGSIVADQNNNYWVSRAPNNLNNDPQNSPSQWEPYFGPLSVSLYDSSLSYFSGELVYTLAGDGTYNVYMSLFSANAIHPALPNEWLSTTVYSINDVVQQFPAWSSLTTYVQGNTVLYTDNNTYASLTNSNTNNPPSSSPTNWALVPVLQLQTQPVPITKPIGLPQSSPVLEWSQGTTYTQGAIVMFKGTQYLSLQSSNVGNFPNVSGSTFWIALSLGVLSMSLIDLNLGNSPANAPVLWSSITTYAIGNFVGASDGMIYKSLSNGNLNNNPVTDAGVHWQNTGAANPWTIVFTLGGGNAMWRQIGGAAFPTGVGLSSFKFIYPIQSGPRSQFSTRNVYRLPAGYLRTAPQDPKAGAVSYLGAATGLVYNDWEYESDFLVTQEVNPIVLRFVADVTDVTRMDPLFCEGLAARIALEVCEPLTQSTSKIQIIQGAYTKFMTEARTVNGIETGAEEPPVDEYISDRL